MVGPKVSIFIVNDCASISIVFLCVYRHDMMITSHIPRTYAHLKGDSKLRSINIPLLDLELNHVIPDNLHLMLRVMDVLIQGLIDTRLAYNRHQYRLSRSCRSFKPLDGPMLNNLVMSIRKCGVYFCLYEQPAEMAEDVQKVWKVASHMAYVMRYEYHIHCILNRILMAFTPPSVHVLLHPVMIYTKE